MSGLFDVKSARCNAQDTELFWAGLGWAGPSWRRPMAHTARAHALARTLSRASDGKSTGEEWAVTLVRRAPLTMAASFVIEMDDVLLAMMHVGFATASIEESTCACASRRA